MKRKMFSVALALPLGLSLLTVPASAAARASTVKPVEGYESSAAYEFQGFSEGVLSMYLSISGRRQRLP